jgi:hypothetical protein
MVIPQAVNESKDNCTRVGPRGRHEGGMMAITQRHPSGWWTVGWHEGEVIAIPVSVNETALADSDESSKRDGQCVQTGGDLIAIPRQRD